LKNEVNEENHSKEQDMNKGPDLSIVSQRQFMGKDPTVGPCCVRRERDAQRDLERKWMGAMSTCVKSTLKAVQPAARIPGQR
jgi:hypothetical protein